MNRYRPGIPVSALEIAALTTRATVLLAKSTSTAEPDALYELLHADVPDPTLDNDALGVAARDHLAALGYHCPTVHLAGDFADGPDLLHPTVVRCVVASNCTRTTGSDSVYEIPLGTFVELVRDDLVADSEVAHHAATLMMLALNLRRGTGSAIG